MVRGTKGELNDEQHSNAGGPLDRSGFFPDSADHPSRQAQSAQLVVDWKALQNADGGWAYRRGPSWTEPTALVLLAQLAQGEEPGRNVDQASFPGGVRFLRSASGDGGGYRPSAQVAESTWVTALVSLLPPDIAGETRYEQAIHWLRGQTGRESGWRYKLQMRLNGNHDEYPDGWPWFPGAAAWVIPTSLGILAFERARVLGVGGSLESRIEDGRKFLSCRICADGGWNHGSNQALGRDGDSYPETTGIGLLAMAGAARDPKRASVIARAKAAAKRHLATCRTVEGTSWLRMGLAAHGETVEAPAQMFPPRTVADRALLTLANAKRNPLIHPLRKGNLS
jgi:hypothetical protein